MKFRKAFIPLMTGLVVASTILPATVSAEIREINFTPKSETSKTSAPRDIVLVYDDSPSTSIVRDSFDSMLVEIKHQMNPNDRLMVIFDDVGRFRLSNGGNFYSYHDVVDGNNLNNNNFDTDFVYRTQGNDINQTQAANNVVEKYKDSKNALIVIHFTDHDGASVRENNYGEFEKIVSKLNPTEYLPIVAYGEYSNDGPYNTVVFKHPIESISSENASKKIKQIAEGIKILKRVPETNIKITAPDGTEFKNIKLKLGDEEIKDYGSFTVHGSNHLLLPVPNPVEKEYTLVYDVNDGTKSFSVNTLIDQNGNNLKRDVLNIKAKTPMTTINAMPETTGIDQTFHQGDQVNLNKNMFKSNGVIDSLEAVEDFNTSTPGTDLTAKIRVKYVGGGSQVVNVKYTVKPRTDAPVIVPIPEVSIDKQSFYKGDKVDLDKIFTSKKDLIKSVSPVEGSDFDTSKVATDKEAKVKVVFNSGASRVVHIHYEVKDRQPMTNINAIPEVTTNKQDFALNSKPDVPNELLYHTDGEVSKVERLSDFDTSELTDNKSIKIKVSFNDGFSRIVDVPYSVTLHKADKGTDPEVTLKDEAVGPETSLVDSSTNTDVSVTDKGTQTEPTVTPETKDKSTQTTPKATPKAEDKSTQTTPKATPKVSDGSTQTTPTPTPTPAKQKQHKQKAQTPQAQKDTPTPTKAATPTPTVTPSKSPKTGDTTNTIPLFASMLGSFAGIVAGAKSKFKLK